MIPAPSAPTWTTVGRSSVPPQEKTPGWEEEEELDAEAVEAKRRTEEAVMR